MSNEIQHHLVHARDLADSAARLAAAALEINNSGLQWQMEDTARQLLSKADTLLKEAP